MKTSLPVSANYCGNGGFGCDTSVATLGGPSKTLGSGFTIILPLLLQLHRPTFFTCDVDFFKRQLCHERYCLVWLDVRPLKVAEYARRVLHHPAFKTQSARMGCLIAAAPTGLTVWRLREERPQRLPWSD